MTTATGQPIAILGAGLSGLSLACALLEHGERRPIVLVDRRRAWARDRTWCTWDTRPGLRFTELADRRWSSWRVAAGGRETRAGSAAAPYLHLDAGAVLGRAVDRLAGAPNVELRTGVHVLGIDAGGPRPVVRTSGEAIEAALVVDARGPGSPAGPLPQGAPAPVEVAQRFLGWEVETDVPVFEREVATLMEFRKGPPGGVRFLYVLPFSPTRALVEDTSIGGPPVPAADRRAELENALADRGAREWHIHYEERGSIPMTTRRFALHPAPRVFAVGTAGGAVRPSSGYAFTRIQLHCTALARALVAGQAPPVRLAPRRLELLDTVFLHAFATAPARFPEIFRRMVEAVPGDAFARFMTDASTPADEGRLIAALPKLPFLAAAARTGLPRPALGGRRAARNIR